MTFKQAAAKLKKIADGRYHGLSFEMVIVRPEYPVETKCRVYITTSSSVSSPICYMENGHTWAEAFDKLDAAMKGLPEPHAIEEMPSVSDQIEKKEATTSCQKS